MCAVGKYVQYWEGARLLLRNATTKIVWPKNQSIGGIEREFDLVKGLFLIYRYRSAKKKFASSLG